MVIMNCSAGRGAESDGRTECPVRADGGLR